MDSDVKSWDRPWSLDEIRENSANWNLAGDAGLLKHLEEFSKDLIKKTHVTKANFDHLFMDINHISTDLSNVTNSFLYLSNTQFVESRVYDDDDEQEEASNKVTQETSTSNSKSKEELDSEKINNIREAFNYGMSILDSMYEVVEVPATSDSEDETSTSHNGAILKPKNAYIERPLPFIIGSREFMEDDNIGLQDANSDNEDSPDQNFEESSIGSDLEMDVNKTQFDKLSDISAEMSNKASPSNKTNSTNDVVENMFGNTENTNMFNENLLNKSSSDFNNSNERIGSENSLFGESYKDDIFGSIISNKDNLFNSTEKEKEFNKDPSLLPSNNNIQAESYNSEVFPSTSTKKFPSKITDNLFAENDDDDDLFQTNINKSKELPKNNEKTKIHKTPAGGVPIFKNVDIFNKNTMKKEISIDPNDYEEDNDIFSKNSKEQSNNSSKFYSQSNKTNILSSTESEDIFSEAKTSQARSSKELPPEINERKPTKKISSLFSDSDSENEDLLFVSKSSTKNASYKSDVSSDIFSDNHSNTFDNSTTKDTSKININNIFDDVEDDLFSNDIFNTKNSKEKDMFNISAPKNLFDQNFDDQNTIFENDSRFKNENIIKPNPPKTLNLLKTTEITDIFEQSIPIKEEEEPPSNKDKSEKPNKVPAFSKDPSKTDDIVINVPSKPVILQSALKERARIQIKRKPSSRKARQESYKQSADSIDYFTNDHSSREFLFNKNSNEPLFRTLPSDPLETNGDVKVQNTNSPLDHNASLFQDVSKPLTSTNLSSLLSPSTDEEDIFGIPHDISTTDKDHLGFPIGSNIFQGAKIISPKNPTITQSNHSSDLFDQNTLFGNNRKAEEEDDDLFSGQNSNILKIGHSTTAKASTSLFDDDDNLFDTIKINPKSLPGKLLSNSLFDDDDNDDIFFTKKN